MKTGNYDGASTLLDLKLEGLESDFVTSLAGTNLISFCQKWLETI